ncbi:CHAT domain-containing protein [Micromonospora sp. WMMD882]|uniref:CHAT domain-containing protein n=1 Tax=Micromonospora sp. WMMD882 TaxID=3015151 RepID=UPI00248D0FE4|nr:CHAT domain-containing protein [Micromonospora sp. WMMD882]WBB80611.1 CHAT domain-containing protein [Micromonospora sp. WMMD882]
MTAQDADEGGVGELLPRCALTVARLIQGEGTPEDVEAAVADLRRLPADLPERGPLAAGLVVVLLRSGLDAGMGNLRHLDDLLAIADRHPPPGPDWPRIRAVARVTATLRAGATMERRDMRAALREVTALTAVTDADPGVRQQLGFMQAGMAAMAAAEEGDLAGLRRGISELEGLRATLDNPELAGVADMMVTSIRALAATQQGDFTGLPDTVERIRDFSAGFGPQHILTGAVRDMETAMAPLRPLIDPDGPSAGPVSDEQLDALRALADRPDASPAERALYQLTAESAWLTGSDGALDPGRLDQAVDTFRRVVADTPTGDPQRAFYLVGLGLALYRRTEVTGRVDGLDEAVRALTEARLLARGPEHPQWSLASEVLAAINRRLGETSGARRIAIDGLRRHAWSALFQADPAAVAGAVRDAAESAVQIARDCLADNEPADAIGALEAGRGLLLFAATEFHSLDTRLDAVGRRDLAHRWRVAAAGDPAAVPAELRREALAALSTPDGATPAAAAGLLDPPTLPEIRSALQALDADALVYLVSGQAPAPGWAVIAPAQGPPSFIPLPNLQLDEEVDVERYLAALSHRDAVLAETRSDAPDPERDLKSQAAESRFLGSLDALCDWAWRAAVGPLVERYLARRPAPPSGRPPRVVLVPVGSLARIPWQAARRADGRYAVELAAFSQTVSARTLCDSAARSAVPVTPLGLVVGDPDTAGEAADLAAARVEAYGIHQAFYRGARYVGRRPDGSTSRSGPGDGGVVRDWLTDNRPGAGAMLHLACHGVIQTDPTDTSSYLLLAGGDRLTAEELVGLLAAGERPVGLVVLAACRTGVSGRGYDEAYSLGTTFLAGGVRSALSTQWRIPDRATSVLMFMFHHFLVAERRPVWDALRRAQLWMLDPRRQCPDRMPPALRRQVTQTEPARVVAWAGFTHWGQ